MGFVASLLVSANAGQRIVVTSRHTARANKRFNALASRLLHTDVVAVMLLFLQKVFGIHAFIKEKLVIIYICSHLVCVQRPEVRFYSHWIVC